MKVAFGNEILKLEELECDSGTVSVSRREDRVVLLRTQEKGDVSARE